MCNANAEQEEQEQEPPKVTKPKANSSSSTSSKSKKGKKASQFVTQQCKSESNSDDDDHDGLEHFVFSQHEKTVEAQEWAKAKQDKMKSNAIVKMQGHLSQIHKNKSSQDKVATTC